MITAQEFTSRAILKVALAITMFELAFYYRSGKPRRECLIESFNAAARRAAHESILSDTYGIDACRKLAHLAIRYNKFRPHSSLGNQQPAEAARALEAI